MTPYPWKGYLALTAAQIAIGINVVASKYLITCMPSHFLLGTRFFVSSLILVAWMYLSKSKIVHPKHPNGKLNTSDWKLSIFQGLMVGAGFNFFFLEGLQYTSAASAGIIASSLPASITILAVLFLKETLNARKIAALLLVMTGIIIMGLTAPASQEHGYMVYVGDFLIFLAMFPEASYSIINKLLFQRVTSIGSATIANVVSFLTFLPFLWIVWHDTSFGEFTMLTWGLIGVASISSLCFFCLWAWGVSFIPASTAAIFGGVMPISTLVLAIIFLHESLFIPDLIGMVLIFTSIGLATSRPKSSIIKPILEN